MRVGWRIVAEIEYFCKITLLFNQVRPINTSVSYKQSPLFLPLLRGEVYCIATQKLISREHSTIVKEKLNMFQ